MRGGGRRMAIHALWATVGAAGWVVPFLAIRRTLLGADWTPAEANLYGTVMAAQALCLWLPPALWALLAPRHASFPRSPSPGSNLFPHPTHDGDAPARDGRGRTVALGLGLALAGGATALACGLLVRTQWAQGVALAFALLVVAGAGLARRLRLSEGGAQGVVLGMTGLCLSLPWWSRPALEALPEGTVKLLLQPLATWLAPLATVGTAFPASEMGGMGYNFAFLPRMYNLWMGPGAAYAHAAWQVVALYLGLAAMLHVCAWGLGDPPPARTDAKSDAKIDAGAEKGPDSTGID